MERRRCKGCGRYFVPSARVGDRQAYCGRPSCQRTRKRRWTREKLRSDEAYRLNHVRAQKSWRERNPGYWKRYRAEHPAYTERNRQGQKQRNRRPRAQQGSPFATVANRDAIQGEKAVISGRYKLTRVEGSGVAKMDEILVEIRSLSIGSSSPGGDCKVMTR